MTTKAAIYVRVSTAGQEEDGSSLETQEEACRGYAAEHGYDVTEVYREVFSGAEYWDRPELTRLRDAMRERAVDRVIAYAIDRLSRESKHIGALMTDADRVGTTFEFVTEKLEDTPVGRMILAGRAFAAEIEREKIRERSLRGKRARVTGGKIQNHGIELFGYRRDKELGTREVIEPEAIIVRQVFTMLATGTPLREIVRRLAEQQVPSPSGNPGWARSQLARMARNPAYKGAASAWRFKREKGRVTIRPETEWIALPGTTPAIVDEATWDRAQVRLATNNGEATKNGARPYLLRGMVWCATCGARMYAMSEKGTRIYRCSSREKGGACGGARVRADVLEDAVWTATDAWLQDPAEIMAELRRKEQGEPDHGAERQRVALVAHAAKLERQQRTITSRIAEADDAELARQLQERWTALQADRTRIADEIAAIVRRAAAEQHVVANMRAVTAYAKRVARGIAAFGFDEKRSALDALQTRVIAAGSNPADWMLEGVIPASIEGVMDTTRGRCARPPRRPPGRA
jgi:site-specific DNA recombinase